MPLSGIHQPFIVPHFPSLALLIDGLMPAPHVSLFSGEYAGVFDPLDGSSNIEAGLPVGTIFGILRRPMKGFSRSEDEDLQAIMQKGSKLLASGIVSIMVASPLLSDFSLSLWIIGPS